MKKSMMLVILFIAPTLLRADYETCPQNENCPLPEQLTQASKDSDVVPDSDVLEESVAEKVESLIEDGCQKIQLVKNGTKWIIKCAKNQASSRSPGSLYQQGRTRRAPPPLPPASFAANNLVR